MELIRNKVSGKFFILLDDSGASDILVITPEGKLKRLKRYLFASQDFFDPEEAVRNKRLTRKQVEIYSELKDAQWLA